MRSMAEITEIAARRKGGFAALDGLLTRPLTTKKICKIPDSQWLSEMTKCVFQAGFNWNIIENKWHKFEEAFEGFDIYRWKMMSDDDFDRLLVTKEIVRNAAKIRSVNRNATFLSEIVDVHGSVGNYFSAWKSSDFGKNLNDLQKRGDRLGGKTSQIFLQRMGVDAIAFTPDVIKALKREKIIDRIPSSKKDWVSMQSAIDSWCVESKRSLMEISQILAFSVD